MNISIAIEFRQDKRPLSPTSSARENQSKRKKDSESDHDSNAYHNMQPAIGSVNMADVEKEIKLLIAISKDKCKTLWKVIFELVKIRTLVKSKVAQQEQDKLSEDYAAFVISAILFYRNASPVFRNIFVISKTKKLEKFL